MQKLVKDYFSMKYLKGEMFSPRFVLNKVSSLMGIQATAISKGDTVIENRLPCTLRLFKIYFIYSLFLKKTATVQKGYYVLEELEI